MTSWRRAPFRRAERHRRAPGGPSSLLAVAAEPRSRIRRVEVGGPPRLWWFFAVERGGALCVAPGLTEALGINVQSATHPHRWIQVKGLSKVRGDGAVSYTHLTLPTIY